ncbi:MAG: hypothetical protein V3T83_01525 [Acidobacteriota bacterium]
MPVSDIREIRILPPLAIARLGSSPQPMDNYDLQDPDQPTGFRTLVPAETLVVENGSIDRAQTADEVRFRDAQGRIRPVAPFLEVWARFEEDGELEPLTSTHLDDLGLTPSDVTWQVQVANLKALRRTGQEDDRILADSGDVSDHSTRNLLGQCNNFKPGKSIAFGSVQYIQPTGDFPEIRLRFTPASGLVFGPRTGDPNIADDVYDAARGQWDNHFDGDPTAPPSTVPGGIYTGRVDSQSGNYISSGYLDDACDGIAEVRLSFEAEGEQRTLNAMARISSGPPDFAPDSLHVRNLEDDLEQMAFGPEVRSVSAQDVTRIMRHAVDTVRLMETRVMNGNPGVGGVPSNGNNMAGQDTGYDRAFEPIFEPRTVDPTAVRGFHIGALQALSGGTAPWFLDLLRSYDQVGDLTDAGRRRMPGMMRGSDGLHLALTRRQRDKVRAARDGQVIEPQPDPGPEPIPEPQPEPSQAGQDMQALVNHFSTRAALHMHLDANGQPFGQLFPDPPALLAFLREGVAQGGLAGAVLGQPLVVAGDPASSAFVRMLRNPSHPMNGPFSRQVPGVGKTGLEIVENWIASLEA